MKIGIIAAVAVLGMLAGGCRKKPVEVPEATKPQGPVLADPEPVADTGSDAESKSEDTPDGKADLSKRTVKSALPGAPEDGPPYAVKVPGMTGYVFSPFAAGKKIEIIGYPPGTIVKCPYTGKELRVP